jgi:N-methylhydantoinase B
VYTFDDEMDDDGTGVPQPTAAHAVLAPQSRPQPARAAQPGPRVKVTVTVDGDGMTVDYSGSSPAVAGAVNAVQAITEAATWYVVRCLAGADIPANSGTFAAVQVQVPQGCFLNATRPHAVAGGNIETSQRVVDALLGALAQAMPHLIPAASQGTMNNITVGGHDPDRDAPFAYCETVGGGAGAGPQGDGLSGVHVHMTNTLNTPVEALEYAYPFRVRRYALRRGSGGTGKHSGGDGLVRDVEFLCPATVTLLTERRRTAPYGLGGGQPGARGHNLLIRAGDELEVAGKAVLQVKPGDIVSVATPGGGGWGSE